MNKYCSILLLGICFYFLLPINTMAAELYLEIPKDEYSIQETFIINIRINVGHNENINAVDGYLRFPKDILKIKDFSTGNSILTFVEEPKINQEEGLISFVGIIPGGYGGLISGDPGQSNLLGKMIFDTTSAGSAQVIFQDGSQVLLSDGKGTPAKLATKGVVFNIKELELPTEGQSLKNEWQDELEKDKIPPEDFKPEIVEINGEYYLVFSTKDKGSGVDHYEILEEGPGVAMGKLFLGQNWTEKESPYLLKDQSLSSNIKVKVVDKAGNEKIIELPVTYSLPWYKNYFIWVIILVLLSFLSFQLWYYLKTKEY